MNKESTSPGASPTSAPNIWSQAAKLAAKTPESRNRYVDLLRAVSIFAVVFGHWLMAAPYVTDGGIQITSMLEHQEWKAPTTIKRGKSRRQSMA